MSIDRVATSTQAQYLLSQVSQAQVAMNKSQAQVASGKTATDYAGIGDKTAALEAARSAGARTDAYQAATDLALNQANLQDTQMSALSDLANSWRQDITTAVGNGDASTLATQAQSVLDQLNTILNSKDANGNYMYGGDKNTTQPLNASTLADLQALPSASDAFANGTVKSAVRVSDGQTVQVGMLASDAGSQLLASLKSVADFNAGPTGNLGTPLTDAQSTFLSGAITDAAAAAAQVNNAAATNGAVYTQLQDASTAQQSMSTVYKGFVSDIENVDMGTAVSNLNQNQLALQAALEVTAQLNQISLLNYLSPSSNT
ncbi:MAG TPA: flagellin [Rhizomicrobium sp.]|jgi:flagellar hook-associated protein 3 FlgL